MKKELERQLIDMETLERFVPAIRIAVHPLRLRIIDFLHITKEPQTVNQIVDATDAGQACVSQQLRILKDANIVMAKRSGNNVLYSIANHNIVVLLDCIRNHGACG